MKNKKIHNSGRHEKILCDLNFPRLQIEPLDLESHEFDQFEESIKKIETMTWDQIYKSSSKTQDRDFSWEIIENQETKSGNKVASIRISKKLRARICREGQHMRFISLHLDRDSASEGANGADCECCKDKP